MGFPRERVKFSLTFVVLLVLVFTVLNVKGKPSGGDGGKEVREKRGAAYAGGHPGGGAYLPGGVGIPGLNNVIQYSAYNQLLNSGHQGQSSGYGGGSSHGRKLTVDQAIGMFGHHTLNTQYPYTGGHNNGGGGSSRGISSSYGSSSGSGYGGGKSGGGGGGAY